MQVHMKDLSLPVVLLALLKLKMVIVTKIICLYN